MHAAALPAGATNNSKSGPPSWPKWPKILSHELFSPKWLNDLSPTEQGARLQESPARGWKRSSTRPSYVGGWSAPRQRARPSFWHRRRDLRWI